MRQKLHWHQIVRRLIIGLLLLPLPASAFNDAQFEQATQLLDQLVVAALQGQIEQIDRIKQHIESIPKPPRGDRKQARQYNDAGLERFRQSNYRQAFAYFQEALKADPGDVEIVANAGQTCLMLEDASCALDHLSIALILDPDRTSSWVPMAEALAHLDQPDNAAAAYALAYHFSVNQEKTRAFLEAASQKPDPRIGSAIRAAFQSPLIGLTSVIDGGVLASTNEDEGDGVDYNAFVPDETLSTAPSPSSVPLVQPQPNISQTLMPTSALASVSAPTAMPAAPTTATSVPDFQSMPQNTPALAQAPAPGPVIAPINLPASTGSTAPTGAASSDSDQVQVVSQGMGIDADSALRNAYSNAIQQALGLYVDAETLVQNDQIIKEQVLTHSRGLIQEVVAVNQGTDNGLYTVTIRATVLKQPLLEKVKPMLQSTAEFDGTSLHAAIVTQKQQSQDAAALLAEKLKPLIGPGIFDFELDGQPEWKEGDKTTLLVPVKVSPNKNRYNNLVQELMKVLDQISIEKREISFTGKQLKEWRLENVKIKDRVILGKGDYDPFFAEFIRDRKVQSIIISYWSNNSLTQSRWIAYVVPNKAISNATKKIFNDLGRLEGFDYYRADASRFNLEASILNQEGELIALGIDSSLYYPHYDRHNAHLTASAASLTDSARYTFFSEDNNQEKFGTILVSPSLVYYATTGMPQIASSAKLVVPVILDESALQAAKTIKIEVKP